jgi:hypothetical protein
MWWAAGGIVVVEGRVWHDPCRIDRSIMALFGEGGINPIWCLSCDRLQQVVWRSGNGTQQPSDTHPELDLDAEGEPEPDLEEEQREREREREMEE